MNVHCANPHAQFVSHKSEIENVVLEVMNSGRFILGQQVELFEKEFAEFIGVSDVIGVANGTDAIEITLRALGIKQGDEVITVSHTAVATVAAIEAAGAIPVLVDVDSDYFTINPDQLDEVFSVRTKALIAVHLYGQSVDLDTISEFCERKGIFLIEDCSQAHGAKWKGKRLGSFGHASCFSCYPTKNLGAIGDAGLIATNSDSLAQKIRMLREYGWGKRYISKYKGKNSRLDELQAAVLRIKLRTLDASNTLRINHARTYYEGLQDLPILLPKTRKNSEHVFHLFVIQSNHRRDLIDFLSSQGVETGIHYPLPIHMQPAYKFSIQTSSVMSVTEELATKVLSLPMYPELNSMEILHVISSVRSFFEKSQINENY